MVPTRTQNSRLDLELLGWHSSLPGLLGTRKSRLLSPGSVQNRYQRGRGSGGDTKWKESDFKCSQFELNSEPFAPCLETFKKLKVHLELSAAWVCGSKCGKVWGLLTHAETVALTLVHKNTAKVSLSSGLVSVTPCCAVGRVIGLVFTFPSFPFPP